MQTTVILKPITNTKPTPRLAGDDRLFLAGHKAPAGHYRLVGTEQEVHLDQEDNLPATCDGRVAVYERRVPAWAERQLEQKPDST